MRRFSMASKPDKLRLADKDKPPIAPTHEISQPRNRLEALLEARGIGIEMAKGIDLDEHLRQVREG